MELYEQMKSCYAIEEVEINRLLLILGKFCESYIDLFPTLNINCFSIFSFIILDLKYIECVHRVLWEGRERVMPDSQVVEFSVGGRSANINPSGHTTYMTYRLVIYKEIWLNLILELDKQKFSLNHLQCNYSSSSNPNGKYSKCQKKTLSSI